MGTLLVAVGSFVAFIVAYNTYGRWLSKRIFSLDEAAVTPSHELRDDVDFVPTKKEIIFGHHFTSIAGTGPIVGPAIAVFWGWLPALVWVLFGSIFIGAVHDFGALVISLRNRGQTIGEVAGRIITPRAKLLFLLVLFMALTIVLAIFGLVIASIFALYPESVLSVWIEIPIAIAIGFWVYKKNGTLLVPSIAALGLLYLAIYLGAYHFPITLEPIASWVVGEGETAKDFGSPVVQWTLILLGYCFVASVLPVWTLLQPRDYINSHQLVLALALLVCGLFYAGITGTAELDSAPAVAETSVANAPPIFPFLFITIACGAVSGFHCLVSSGTSSKQVSCEIDAQTVGYGAMLLEGALAVIVILACTAGIGIGKYERITSGNGQYSYEKLMVDGKPVAGRAAWTARYDAAVGWTGFGLAAKVGAFIEGGANFLNLIGLPIKMAIGIMAVLVASFAATTLDTATRLQRYVVQELGTSLRIPLLPNRYFATAFAVILGGAVALFAGKVPGKGGMVLWPLFGATNQLLAGLALMVIVFYLWRRSKPVWFIVIPMVAMCVLPMWALGWQLFNVTPGPGEAPKGWFWALWPMLTGDVPWQWRESHLWSIIGLSTLVLQLWMILEAFLLWPKAKGVIEEELPPLASSLAQAGGRSC